MKFKSIIWFLFSVFLIQSVLGTVSVTLNYPSNNSYVATSSVTFNYTVTGEYDYYICELFDDHSGTFSAIKTESSIPNNTLSSFVKYYDDINGMLWNVRCYPSTLNVSNATFSSNNYTLTIDTVNPSVTATVTDGSWDTDGRITFSLTVVDENPAVCKLFTTLNASTNSSGDYEYKESVGYSNTTLFNFTAINETQKYADHNGANYYYSYWCNDSAGNYVASDNITFFVDTIAPTVPELRSSSLINKTSSDLTPTIYWTTVTEKNFSEYTISVYNDESLTSLNYSQAVSSKSTTSATLNSGNLAYDAVYYVIVNATDLAGNHANSAAIYKYTTDSTCAILYSGWNICGNMGNAINLSDLLTRTGATTVAIWNDSHQFQSHVSGGNNGDVVVPYGGVYFAYVSSQQAQEFDWNTSVLSGSAAFQVNLTNQTASDWNLVMNMNYTTSFNFTQIDKYMNGLNYTYIAYTNVTLFHKYNNSGGNWIGYYTNWTSYYNSETSFEFGEVIAMYLNDPVLSYTTIDWREIK